MEAKFEIFWNTLNECPYELPVEIKSFLKKSLTDAGFSAVVSSSAPASSGSVASGVKTKKLSGYNVFMKEKMAELKTQNVPSGDRMTQVSVLWKECTDEDKAEWKAKASASNVGGGATSSAPASVASTTSSVAKVKKLSGYQLYVRETMPDVKADTSVGAKERMGEIGRRWKALTDADHTDWSDRAKALA
jgi:hypothetical protein